MKQAALIRRKQWDILFVLNACDYGEFAAIVREGELLRGKLEACCNPWQQLEVWHERNWMQFRDGRNQDVVFVSARSLPWRPSLARFLPNFHHAIPSWQSPRKDSNAIAMRDAKRAFKRYMDKHIFVLLKGGVELLPRISEFINGPARDFVVAVTVIGNQKDFIVPWLWAIPFEPSLDDELDEEMRELAEMGLADYARLLEQEDKATGLDDEAKDAIDEAVKQQQHLAQEHPELDEEDAHRMDC